MEKKKPHYDLHTIQQTFVSAVDLRITRTALRSAEALDIALEEIVAIIQKMNRSQFFKSMTSIGNHAIWQDVYHVPYEGLTLYVKFTTDAEGHVLISFKEK